jgi:hypothetical protein
MSDPDQDAATAQKSLSIRPVLHHIYPFLLQFEYTSKFENELKKKGEAYGA